MVKNIIAILLITCALFVNAQRPVPALEKEISITLTNVPLGTALEKIANQAGFVFSYNPTLINTNKVVSLKADKKSVREVLAMLLGETISYRSNGMYVILSKAEAKKKVVVSGYVYDKNTGKKLPNTTVYDANTMSSSISNDYGYYEITLPKKEEKVNLVAAKNTYADTAFSVSTAQNQMVQIDIEPAPTDSLMPTNPFREAGAKFLKGFKAFVNNINVKDTLNRRFQLSLLPYVGSNGLLSGNVINQLSFNLIGGYSYGNKGAEFGGIFNINRRNVSGFQGGGIFNVVGGSFDGFQAAGILNSTKQNFNGFQSAGIMNIAGDTVRGFQAAGMFNLALGPVQGFQAAGFMNINTDTVRAFSAAGFANIASKKHIGVQTAGLFNYSTSHTNGAQIAGLFNSSLDLHNTGQIAGLMNFSARRSGVIQLAGLLNYATELHGLQLGLLNITDTCTKGTQIGLLCVERKGVHQIELSTDEMLFANLAIRTGTHGFHNIFSGGLYLQDTQSPIWSIGYGVGTSIKMHKRWYFDIDLTYNHISKGAFNTNVNFLNKLYLGPEFAITKKVKLAFGITGNLFLSNTLQTDYTGTFANFAPYVINEYTSASADLNIKWWLGGKVAIRFF